MAPLKLHRCSNTWAKIGAHPCWKVQKALDEQGIEYEIVTGPQARGEHRVVEGAFEPVAILRGAGEADLELCVRK